MYKILANVHNYKKRIPSLFLQLLLFRKLRTRTGMFVHLTARNLQGYGWISV